MGRSALAAALTVPGTSLRAFLHWNVGGGTLPDSTATALTAATGASVCQGLTNDPEGTVVAVSLPDPPISTRTGEPQSGRKPGSPGRLLPGLLTGSIPEGWTMDEGGFLLPVTMAG